MARVTVEDCVTEVPNRFDLVMLAAQRSRGISAGAELTVERDNDKNPVVALREIADQKLELNQLRDNIVHGLQRHVETEDDEEEIDDGFGPAVSDAVSAFSSEPAPAAPTEE